MRGVAKAVVRQPGVSNHRHAEHRRSMAREQHESQIACDRGAPAGFVGDAGAGQQAGAVLHSDQQAVLVHIAVHADDGPQLQPAPI